MPALATNNAWGKLNVAISATITQIVLQEGQGDRFPTPVSGKSWFWATIISEANELEVVKVTARSVNTFTVVRGQDNTEAKVFAAGSRVELRPTAALFNYKVDEDTLDDTVASAMKTLRSEDSAMNTNLTKLINDLKDTVKNDYVSNDSLEDTLKKKDTDNSGEYLTQASAKANYLPLAGGTMTGALVISRGSSDVSFTMTGGSMVVNSKTVSGSSIGGNITASGTVQGAVIRASSDRRFKKNIKRITDGAEVITKLKPVRFKWKHDGTESTGLIAQDVQKVIPEIVSGSESAGYAVNYNGVIPFLIDAIQQLQAEIKELKNGKK